VSSPYLIELCAFLLGLEFGSFLNVCIARLPRMESVVTPRSHCMACGHTVRWRDNVPLLSWLLLRGRCRDCQATIPWRYPAVELAVAVWFWLAGGRLWLALASSGGIGSLSESSTEAALAAVGFAVLGFLLIGLMVIDWQTQRLPDTFTLSGIGAGLLLACVQAIFLAPGEGDVVLGTDHQLRLSSPGSFTAQGNVFMTGPEALVFGRVASVAGAALILLAVRWSYKRLRRRDGMGLGDVKLLAMIAAFLGFGKMLLALLVGVVAASAYGLELVARGRARRASRIAFGSFLAGGGLVAAQYGGRLLAWYIGLLR